MNDDDRDSSPTIPPKRGTSPLPEPAPVPPRVTFSDPPAERLSNPDIWANAPPWAADLLHRFEGVTAREQERAEMAHRGQNKVAAAFLKVEANVELMRQEVLGCRSDVQVIGRHLGELEFRLELKMAELEQRLEDRFAAVEARVAAIEEAKKV